MYSTRFLDLPPLAAAAGTVHLPGSKSISNRVLLLAGLCVGFQVLNGVQVYVALLYNCDSAALET